MPRDHGEGQGRRALVRYRTGVHPLRGRRHHSLWLAQAWHAPEASGTVLLLRRGRECLWTSHRREPLPRVHLRGHPDRGNQRRGHARTVGVPGRTLHRNRLRGPPLDVPLHPRPSLRAVRCRRLVRPQAHPRRLEWSRLPHELLHQGDEGGRRIRQDHRGPRAPRRPRQAGGTYRRLRPQRRGRQRPPPHRPPRDRLHREVHLRSRKQGLLRQDPSDDGEGEEGLL
mmetsp:Transcript_10102/g.20459  ORF Transcript_10102/g.20459 Transcript_10102/m.20459 type:complete len:226 (+) Transcript_10102:432-1109(+)